MVEMAFGLPYQHEDSKLAINLVDAQLEQDLSQSLFAREQDKIEMMLTCPARNLFKIQGPNVRNKSQTRGSLD